MRELKPCPLCKSEMHLEKTNYSTWLVRCSNCPLDFGRYWYARKEQAQKAWNRRVGNDRIKV
jgi:ssDNA-binding Zn-finger/Zn-ribbon topoisomerase 1